MSQRIRADSSEANTITFSVNASGAGLTSHSLVRLICYNRFFANLTNSSLCAVVAVSASNSGTVCTVSTNATVGGVLYKVGASAGKYCFSLPTLLMSWSGTINTADIGSYLISIGQLNQWDIMVWSTLEFRGTGAGSYSLSATVATPTVRMITRATNIAIANWTCESLQYTPNPYVVDYINITFSSSTAVLAGMEVDFLYTRNALNV